MKNIYHDDSFNNNKDSNDIFSKTSYDLMREFNQMNPEAPKANLQVDFTENESAVPTADTAARQTPPPIRKSAPPAPAAPQPQTPPAAYYNPTVAYAQQPVYGQPYPQPVFYQSTPGQPVPVFIAPGQPYPAYPQPYPVQPAPYPVQQGIPQQPVYPQPPVAQVPSAPYTSPQQNPYQQPAVVQNDPMSREAGTRVLFQSPDFDVTEDDTSDDSFETLPHNYPVSPARLDISEVELPSRKRAGIASENSAPAFKIDEMEIGTYELHAMSINRSAKATGVEVPAFRKEAEDEASADTVFETTDEVVQTNTVYEPLQEAENKFIGKIIPDEILEEEEKESESKKEKSSSGEIIRKAILFISFAAIVVSCGMLYNEYRLHKKNQDAMNDISNLIITEALSEMTTETTTAVVGAPVTTTKKPAATTKPTTTTRPLTPQEQFELLKKQNPNIVFPDNIQLKYAKLYAENQDFVGYLSIKGTEIDFPIVQGVDDDEYIEKDFFGEYTKYGCPFMTFRNNPKILDMNTVIYGHNMQDGSIFAHLEQYLTLEGYKKAPVISFNTLYQDFNFKIIATMITNIKPEHDNGYVFPYYWTNLNNVLNYTAYLNQLLQRSLYDTGVNVLPTDRILTLSTCFDEFTDARLVVVARLVRPGESTEVNTAKAVENTNPRFPQAYYDEHGKTNPYANAYRWEIS